MPIDFLGEAELLHEKLSGIRKSFHRVPEIGNHEFKTADLIEKYLDEIQIPHKRVLGTGIVARLEGKLPGKNSALRSDIDALPIKESTGCDFSSTHEGFMHACGHDVHMTGVLGAAMILKKHEKDLCGSVKFLFQPDEEIDGGAARMIDEGCVDDVDAIFGAHVDPKLIGGHVGVKHGNFYAASAMFHVVIIGKSAHGAQRENGIDAVEISAQIISEVLKIQGGVVTVGMIQAGTAGNIIAGRSEFRGIIRTFGIDERARMSREFENIVNRITEKFGAKCECNIKFSSPGVINDNEKLNSLVENSARKVLGDEKVHLLEKPLMISEDFGFFILAKTGCFYHIGAGCEFPLHTEKFLPVDDAFVTASAVHSAVVFNFNSAQD